MNDEAAQWVPFFPDREISFILDAVLRCGERLKKTHEKELENSLSDRLRDQLAQDHELRMRPVAIDREVPLYDRNRSTGRPLGRCDLRFLVSTGALKPWPYFVIETKRLHVMFPSGWKSLVDQYVSGKQGMMCFTEQRYAQGLLSGGMLGYVYDGNVDAARERVSDAIKKAAKQLRCQPIFDTLVHFESLVGVTEHHLDHGKFTIYHLFFFCLTQCGNLHTQTPYPTCYQSRCLTTCPNSKVGLPTSEKPAGEQTRGMWKIFCAGR